MNRKKIAVCLVTMLLGLWGFAHSELANAAAAEKRLTVALGRENTSIEPMLSQGNDANVSDNYCEYLLTRGPDSKLVPQLATSWKISPGGKEVEFTLRKGVKFHSGDLMTTKDVIFSFELAKKISPQKRVGLSSVDRVTAIDDYRLNITFKEPDVSFMMTRAIVPIISKSYYDRVGEDAYARMPVTTAPYKMVRYVPGEYLDIERFEDYWGKKPLIKEARFYFVPEDTTRIAKLMAGEVDMINSTPYNYVKEIEKSKDFKLVKFENMQTNPTVFFQVNNPNTPWYKRDVRLAMAHAIDTKAITENIMKGLVKNYAYLAPWDLGYDPSIMNYPYDPKKSRELLAKAGYPNGFDLNLYWELSGRYPMAREINEAVAAYLNAVGIRATPVGEESTAHLERMRASKKNKETAVLVMGRTFGRNNEPSYALAFNFSTIAANGIYSNPEFDKIVNEARATVDDAKRGEIIKKAMRFLYDDVAGVPICNIVAYYSMKKNIDYTPNSEVLFDRVLVKDVVMK